LFTRRRSRLITAGQTFDYLGFDMVMADNRPTPSVLQVDRGYDADSIRKSMSKRDVFPSSPCTNHE